MVLKPWLTGGSVARLLGMLGLGPGLGLGPVVSVMLCLWTTVPVNPVNSPGLVTMQSWYADGLLFVRYSMLHPGSSARFTTFSRVVPLWPFLGMAT